MSTSAANTAGDTVKVVSSAAGPLASASSPADVPGVMSALLAYWAAQPATAAGGAASGYIAATVKL